MNKGEIVTKYFRKISVNNTVASINAAVLFFFMTKAASLPSDVWMFL